MAILLQHKEATFGFRERDCGRFCEIGKTRDQVQHLHKSSPPARGEKLRRSGTIRRLTDWL
jgi:hypothetical protein